MRFANWGALTRQKPAIANSWRKLRIFSTDPGAWGLSARQRGDRDKALEHFLAALTLAPDNHWVIRDAAKAFCALGRLDEAEAVYRDLVAKAPQLSEGPRGLAFVALQRGDHASALAYSQSALDLAPDDVWLINDVANELRELSRLDESEAAYRELMVKAPQLLDGPRGLGLVSNQRGDHASALAHFQTALALAPDNVTLMQEVASQLQELGRKAEAENLPAILCSQPSHSAQALLAYAKSIRHKISEDELIRQFEKAVALEPAIFPPNSPWRTNILKSGALTPPRPFTTPFNLNREVSDGGFSAKAMSLVARPARRSAEVFFGGDGHAIVRVGDDRNFPRIIGGRAF